MRIRALTLPVILSVLACTDERTPESAATHPAVPATPAPRFEDYAVPDTFRQPPAPVDLGSYPDARRFRSVLRSQAAAGPNFAGHLTIVTWGCGTQCRQYFVVDAPTGRVYGDSALNFSCYEPEFRRGSALVLQRPDTVTFGPCSRGPARRFRWAVDQFVEIAPPAT